jgi:hypothetical protein
MKTNTDEIARDLKAAFAVLRAGQVDGSPEDIATCEIETFAAIALRVMRKTNPSKIRSEAMTVEIQARMLGTQVLRGVGQ